MAGTVYLEETEWMFERFGSCRRVMYQVLWTEQSTDIAVDKLRGLDLIFIPELSCILALPINKAAPSPPLTPKHPNYWDGAATGSEERFFSTFLRQILSQHHVIITNSPCIIR